jgi:hypothetical protein
MRHHFLLVGWLAAMLCITLPCTHAAEMILTWSGVEKDPHPCLYLTPAEVTVFQKTRPDLFGKNYEPGWHQDRGGLDDLVAAALIGQNPVAQDNAIAMALKTMDMLLAEIPKTIEQNVGPHAYAKVFGQAAGLSDVALAAKQITPAQRAELVGKIARACYLLNDPRYWNPATGKCTLNPNMATSARGYRLTMAALIPSHPLAKQWFDTALKELQQEVNDWTDPQGGMIECPHYSMVIFDQWLGAFVVARNAGAPADGNLFNPKLRQAMAWFGNISTPRDGGARRWPSLGHTYAGERSSVFGAVATLWQTKDPQFAGEMAWMDREHGSVGEPGILSYYPAMMGYRAFFRPAAIKPKVPTWGSTAYPETGVLLRNTLGSDRETTLYLIAGRNHSHYYDDSGSITLWGKGRELCSEDSYGHERTLEKERGKNIDARGVHSMVDGPATYNPEEVMAIHEFSASPALDYLRGTRRGWQRQIAFIKDSDPLGPNYFVMADTFDAASVPTAWRLYLTATPGKQAGNRVTVVGKEDVDLDLYFLRPEAVASEAHPDYLQVKLTQSGTLTTVLFPRLKTDKPPTVTPWANGRGVKVVTAVGTDYIWLDPSPVAFQEGELTSAGKAGLIRVRQSKAAKTQIGECEVAPGWEGGQRELRMIRWEGPQYPSFPYP